MRAWPRALAAAGLLVAGCSTPAPSSRSSPSPPVPSTQAGAPPATVATSGPPTSGGPSSTGAASSTTRASVPPVVPPRTVPASKPTAPVYGVTVDDVSNSETLTRAIGALPFRSTVRVYFDRQEPASYYLPAVRGFSKVSTIMGELLDSSDERAVSVTALGGRLQDYLGVLGRYVGIWEIGNEVNGAWLGPYPEVSAKLTESYRAVVSRGGRTALTLYANDFGPDNCGDGTSELTPDQFTRSYVPPAVRAGLDYVLLSYYPDQCGGREPAVTTVRNELADLHNLYPRAGIGFGEMGLPNSVSDSDLQRGRQVLDWAYSLDPGLPYYVGGYFWWYAAEDALTPGAPLGATLQDGFRKECAALHQPA